MRTSHWFAQNRKTISDKIQWIFNQPEGILCEHRSLHHHISILKEGSLVRMFFANPTQPEDSFQYSGCMAEYDLHDPLNLIVAYPQALLLSLLWKSSPRNVYIIGFAGGRIPMILHHYFPDVKIESAEIDKDLVPLAEKYFGVLFDQRNRVVIEDGRDFLENKIPLGTYDFIIIDAFRGTGYSPYHLNTADFFKLCKKHLTEGGVVTINLVKTDHLFLEKINTLRISFKHVYLHFDPINPETYVFLGTDGEALAEAERADRAAKIQHQIGFDFSFLKRAIDLKPLSQQDAYLLENFGSSSEILNMKDPPPGPLKLLSSNDPVFFKAEENNRCPCGSPFLFKHCHGKET
ncbi:MAG: fused MFS/spermidine synthase [SAR324 cluster bacterium]|nr:fused MFS/spermidine synthase [SAR324 cluster bacterium]